jgi:hypothetical protein
MGNPQPASSRSKQVQAPKDWEKGAGAGGRPLAGLYSKASTRIPDSSPRYRGNGARDPGKARR